MSANFFISYSQKNSTLADSFDEKFKKYNINITRDIRDVQYKQSIKDYMKKIRCSDYVIMVISDYFLKSENCMFEVLEFIKDVDYKDRIIPVILESAAIIFSNEGKINYISFWENKYKKLENQIAMVEVKNSIKLHENLRHVENICRTISDFLETISDMKNVVVGEDIDTALADMISLFKVDNVGNTYRLRLRTNIDNYALNDLCNSLNKYTDMIYKIDEFVRRDTKIFVDVIAIKGVEFPRLKSLVKEVFNDKYIKIMEIPQLNSKELEYYKILSMDKTVVNHEHTLKWWNPERCGYTDDITDAGLYNYDEVKEITSHVNKNSLGFPQKLCNIIFKNTVITYNDNFLDLLYQYEDFIIGDILNDYSNFKPI